MRPVDEPPGADPHAGWCGEGRLEAGPYPIGQWATRYRCGEKSALVGRQKTRPALEILVLDMLSALKAVAEVAEACPFHYGLRAREFDGRCSDLGDVIIKITDQECA